VTHMLQWARLLPARRKSALSRFLSVSYPFSICPSVLPSEITKGGQSGPPRSEFGPRTSFIVSVNYAHRSPGRERDGK